TPRALGARALPRRGAPRRARARRRGCNRAQGSSARGVAGADPRGRLALAGVQALLRPGTARRRARRRRGPALEPLVRHGQSVSDVVPFLRVRDAEASAAWYARLGFEVEWTHRFDENLPLFVSVCKAGDSRI